jgi:B12-binding domain/radical SAM domain protein
MRAAHADLVLLHPPSVYDFREILSIPNPIGDLVPSTSYFEMYPIGFSFIGEYLERNDINVRVVNLAARMLEKPDFQVEKFLSRLRPLAFGIGFHWLPHCHGALEIARLCKRLHPDIPVIMGGYSATLFDRELMEYPEVDYVVKGDSTEEPLRQLLTALALRGDLAGIPNLTYRESSSGKVIANPLTYVPASLDHLGNNYIYMLRSAWKYRDIWGLRAFKDWWTYPLTAVLTCRGCTKNCTFCGGSAWSMEKCFGRKNAVFRSPERIARDVEIISKLTSAPIFIIGDIRQGGDDYAYEVLEAISHLAPQNQIVLELFEPAPRTFFDRLASSLPYFNLEISPESHDEEIRLAGGKRYTNEELELNISWALESGCKKFDIFFMIGLPGQTTQSVRETISYCSYLLKTYGPLINPLIGPLAPFLDPGSIAHTFADRYGYRLFFHRLEDYRRALLEPHWRDMLSYETEWMTRQEIVDATYMALLELNQIKGRSGLISPRYMEQMDRYLRDCISLLKHLDEVIGTYDPNLRDRELSRVGEEAELLRSRSSLVKEELKWPLAGRRFYLFNILRLIRQNA